MPDEKRRSGAPPVEAGQLRPTVMKVPPVRERTSRTRDAARQPAPGAAVAPPSAPTTVPGVRRERIVATARELRVLSPGASAAACDAAVRLIAAFPAAKASERRAVLWGHDLQKAYGDKVTGTLTLAQDPLVEQARSHVARMMEILGSIDLMGVCGHGKGGLFGGLARSMNQRVDTPGELTAALEELQLLLQRMGAAIDKLIDLADRLRQHASEIGEIEREVEAAALAALFLAERVSRNAPELAQRFTDRAMSLTATVAQVRHGDAVHRIQIEQPLQLIGTIQNVALVTLPGWLGSIASLSVLSQAERKLTPTEAGELARQLRNIVEQLQT